MLNLFELEVITKVVADYVKAEFPDGVDAEGIEWRLPYICKKVGVSSNREELARFAIDHELPLFGGEALRAAAKNKEP